MDYTARYGLEFNPFLNKLCNASLLVGNSANLNIITADAVMQAINDCELG